MEFAGDITLTSSINDSLRRPSDVQLAQNIASWIEQLVDAVSKLHSKGILHCDLKPDNIIIDGRKLTLIDFGEMKAIDPSRGDDEDATDTGGYTPGWAAAERTGDPRRVGKASDVYSVGCIIYELLTGQRYQPGGLFADLDNARCRELVAHDPFLRYFAKALCCDECCVRPQMEGQAFKKSHVKSLQRRRRGLGRRSSTPKASTPR